MRKLCLALGLMMVSLLVVGTAEAALLDFTFYYPDIFSDTGGTYSYTASTDIFTSSATPYTITWALGGPVDLIDDGSYSVSFKVDGSGDFISGVGGDDLVITGSIDTDDDDVYDFTGTLLTGEVTDFGWFDVGTTNAYFDFTFDATGGALISYYDVYDDKGGDKMLSEDTDFDSDFTVDFDGIKTKHNTAPLPEPSSMLLLGMGLFGLAGGMLKKRFKA